MKPLCFVLMPFGRKPDETGRVIDFDAVYGQLIGPAVGKAGLDVIRADEEQVGGTIHKPMFERLLLCEFAVADLTAANPNVCYELGIRHAVRPRSTLMLFAEGTRLPFDVAPLRAMIYRLDADGRPADIDKTQAAIAARMKNLREEFADDSPLFQLVQDMPRFEVDHEKTDLFRQRAEYSRAFKDRLAAARAQDADAVRAVAADPALTDIGDVESGIVVDLFLSYRDVKAYDDMLALYERMSPPLKRARMVQEQRGFALNRLGRHREAEEVLKAVIRTHGPSSETFGLLGRVCKDKWEKAVRDGNGALAAGEHKRAVEAYLAGFEADWRDAYPGVNALALMELGERPDARQAEIAPVVKYAAARKARSPSADYWDHVTLLEVAVLARDYEAAQAAMADALPLIRAGWEVETTVRNLELIEKRRAEKAEATAAISAIIGALRQAPLP